MKFANIIVDISHEKLDRPFGYIIPKELEDIYRYSDSYSIWKRKQRDNRICNRDNRQAVI